jgi:lipopolysaccharide/colanic/teichoic acid biosynthesis glycosyltransferase
MARGMYARYGKRAFDIVVSGTALVLLSPLFVILAVLVWWKLGWPLFFCQERPGLHGRAFRMCKFRSMTDVRGADGNLLPDGERLTAFGRFLRATSLDEMPELWLVLTGKMSLVGPRPLLMKYLPLYTPEQMRRHEVRPGITGWAQIHGRNALAWEEKFRLDVWYVENVSLLLDLRILAATAIKLLLREGVSEPGQATVREFTGSRPDEA